MIESFTRPFIIFKRRILNSFLDISAFFLFWATIIGELEVENGLYCAVSLCFFVLFDVSTGTNVCSKFTLPPLLPFLIYLVGCVWFYRRLFTRSCVF